MGFGISSAPSHIRSNPPEFGKNFVGKQRGANQAPAGTVMPLPPSASYVKSFPRKPRRARLVETVYGFGRPVSAALATASKHFRGSAVGMPDGE
jgi:hypothetical protein